MELARSEAMMNHAQVAQTLSPRPGWLQLLSTHRDMEGDAFLDECGEAVSFRFLFDVVDRLAACLRQPFAYGTHLL